MRGFGLRHRRAVRLARAHLRAIAFDPGVIDNAAEEPLENQREASRAFGEMFDRATRRSLAPVELALERPVAPFGTHAFLLDLETIQMACLALREGIHAIRLHAPQSFGR